MHVVCAARWEGNPIDLCILLTQVRIFTYLIGREAAFADNLKWMACANKGRCPNPQPVMALLLNNFPFDTEKCRESRENGEV